MMTKVDNKMQEKKSIFVCKNCNYTSRNKYNYDKHIITSKHIKQAILLTNIDINTENASKKYTCDCGKKYNHRQSLSIHKKKCICSSTTNEKLYDNESKIDLFDKNTIIQLIKQNQDFQKMLLEQNHKNQELQNTIIEQNQKNQEIIIELASKTTNINSNNNTTNNNNKFNMNIFLNETCKDAMNIMDFVSSLKISFEDLENVGEVGYVKGITNIISNGLNKLDVHKRPIHCSDVKREVFYVKDNDVWEKETEDKKKITRAIKHISYNTARKVTPWTELPENEGVYDYYNKLNDKYSRINSQANGGDPDEVSKIIKNIACKVTINKESL
jgi:hypothetical protein